MDWMQLRAPISRLWPGLAAVSLVALALLPRLVGLESRPVIHDESMFSYYAFVFRERGIYTHMPLLHGPALMLSVGSVFKLLGDSIEVARGFIAVCSLVALAACLGLTPRRYRWWFAPLLFTSPLLLYFSRFMRNEMLFNAVLMLGMLGMTRALSRRCMPALWAVVGVTAMTALLAIKENALFVYAAGATFAIVWIAQRWLLPGPRRALSRARPERRRLVVVAGGMGGLLLGLTIAGLIYGVALPPTHREEAIRAVVGDEPEIVTAVLAREESLPWPQQTRVLGRLVAKSWLNARRSWDYWKGQHMEERISGPLHYHVPILLTYELPLLLLLLVGLAWDAAAGRRRAAAYGGAYLLWLAIWLIWWTAASAEPAGWLAGIQDFLHIGPNGSMMALGLMIAPVLVWSIASLREGRVLAAWMGWWAACSLFQYASAGEKVPWLSVHIALPLYMMLVWLWEPRLERLGQKGRWVAMAVLLVAVSLSLRNDYYLIGERAADPRERVVYNQTTPWIDTLMRNRLAIWKEEKASIPLDQRKVVLVGAPGWPGIWYFRHCRYELAPQGSPLTQVGDDVDLIIGEGDLVQPLIDDNAGGDWVLVEGSLRDHWWAPWPVENRWWPDKHEPKSAAPSGFIELLRSSTASLWRYYWLRETWTEPGGFPVVVLERRRARR